MSQGLRAEDSGPGLLYWPTEEKLKGSHKGLPSQGM